MLKKVKAIVMIVIMLVFAIVGIEIAMLPTSTYAATLEPTSEQFIEFKAVSMEMVNGSKQLTVDVIVHKLDFKGFDLRLQFDEDRINPSNTSTNQKTEFKKGSINNFKFANGFEKFMDILQSKKNDGELRIVISMLGDDQITGSNSYLVNDETIGKYVHIEDEVKLGTFTFKVEPDVIINSNDLKLKTAETSPQLGIKVNKDGTDGYENQSLFKFTLDLLSQDANLAGINVSTGNQIDGTYTEYAVSPTFSEEENDYTIKINEMVDTARLNITKKEANQTIKIRKPKIDEDGGFIRDSEDNIEYEEIINTNEELEINEYFTLAKIGEQDTVIEIIVIAEDGATDNTYTVTIQRPYATITGSIQLGLDLRDSLDETYGIYLEYIANVTLYNPGDFDWDGILTFDSELEELEDIEKIYEIQTDPDTGQFEMKVAPGIYDLDLNAEGFLPIIIKNVDLKEGDTFEVGDRILTEGDANSSGIIEVGDVVAVTNLIDATEGDGLYKKSCDFGRKGFIAIDDLVRAVSNIDEIITIEEFSP